MKVPPSQRQTVHLFPEAYPNLSPKEQVDAAKNLKHHLKVCAWIWKRMKKEGKNPWVKDSEEVENDGRIRTLT